MMKMFELVIVFGLVPADIRKRLTRALKSHRREKISVLKLTKILERLNKKQMRRR